ncbi:hypothetical protein ACQ4M3_40345 [Leptolyngbya sp. AN03gr2]|uniref:hypothetical protein n=1 Tax=unclassified Leptolyngbya TaxID=2650499 RepID=UPI003D31051D
MACQGAVPPTEAEVKQVVQDVMALLSSKYYVYRGPIEQYRIRMMPTLRKEEIQRRQQQRQAADEALERGIYEVLWQDRCESF